MKVITRAILDSRRDWVQVHTCHFSHPPSLTSGRGLVVQLFHCGGRPRRFSLACVAVVGCSRTGLFSSMSLRSSLARGTCLGRCLVTRRNFPDVWYKSKKLCTHLSSYVCACFLMCCSRLTFPGRTGVLAHGGWAGLNAPEDSVWKSPQVMTHLVEQACWMEEA